MLVLKRLAIKSQLIYKKLDTLKYEFENENYYDQLYLSTQLTQQQTGIFSAYLFECFRRKIENT